MKVQAMCEVAAGLTNRAEEFVLEDGATAYADDAKLYFDAFMAGINEAYRDISKRLLEPHKNVVLTIPDSQIIDLTDDDLFNPLPGKIRAVRDENNTYGLPFELLDRDTMKVTATGKMLLAYHYLPTALSGLTDEPVFDESTADPMVYINNACYHMWMSEKKPSLAQPFKTAYYEALSRVGSRVAAARQRVRRRTFR